MNRPVLRAAAGVLAVAVVATLTACASGSAPTGSAAPAGDPVTGGTLTYLEQQAHTNLYPPAGGFYPNGGAAQPDHRQALTYQNPETLEIEPWIADRWTVNADATEYTFRSARGVTFSDGTPLDAAAVAKNFDTYGLGNNDLRTDRLRGDQQLRPQRGRRRRHGEVPLLRRRRPASCRAPR